jgi:hypothetical protein
VDGEFQGAAVIGVAGPAGVLIFEVMVQSREKDDAGWRLVGFLFGLILHETGGRVFSKVQV